MYHELPANVPPLQHQALLGNVGKHSIQTLLTYQCILQGICILGVWVVRILSYIRVKNAADLQHSSSVQLHCSSPVNVQWVCTLHDVEAYEARA